MEKRDNNDEERENWKLERDSKGAYMGENKGFHPANCSISGCEVV